MGVIISRITPHKKSKIATFDTISKDAFKISAAELGKLMNYDGVKATFQLRNSWGGIDGIAKILETDLVKGLTNSNKEDLSLRRTCFGSNSLPPKKTKSFLFFCWAAMQDVIFVILLLCGLSTLSAAFLRIALKPKDRPLYPENIVLVTALNDWQKGRQFLKLQKRIDAEKRASVIRDGEMQEISKAEIVVGDICALTYGDIVPADGFMIHGNGISLDESSVTGEFDRVEKNESNIAMLSGTLVAEGNARMIVTSVGLLSKTGRIFALSADTDVPQLFEVEAKRVEIVAERQKEGHMLAAKLTKMQIHLEYIGLTGAFVTFLTLILRFTIQTYVVDKQTWKYDHIYHYIDCVAQTVTVLIIAVPQSLPLSAALALAFAVRRMLVDNNLVRHLNACETMGNATCLCSDKTGTLTTNMMSVTQCYLAGKHFKNVGDAVVRTPPALADLLCEGISINSAYTSIYLVDKLGYPPKRIGNKTECALLAFTIDFRRNYENYRSKYPETEFVQVFPFTSTRKTMTTVIKKPYDGYYVHTKGACESILGRCKYIVTNDVRSPVVLTGMQKRDILTMYMEAMANAGLRTICLAYKKVPSITGDFQNWKDELEVSKDLTFLCIAGIQDPIRPEVPWAIKKFKRAGLKITMVTGDNLNTARCIAARCGIIEPKQDFLALESSEFNEMVSDEFGNFSQQEFDKVWPRLRVLARSSPDDKYVLVNGIISSKLNKEREVVAVTGDGTNDAPALKSADIGFTMGIQGTDIAKEACDIILLNDNFNSIVKALMWGRNVYDNVAKFLQFQLASSLAAFIFSLVTAMRISRIPLTVIQMIYFNLLLETVTSVALASEKTTTSLLDRKPYGRSKYIISPTMFRNIFGHALYQLTITFILIFKGHKLLDTESTIQILDKDATSTQRTEHFTLVFNTFVFMNLFNEINARKLHGEFNVFGGIFDNWIFVGVWIGSVVLQILVIFFGARAFSIIRLDIVGWGYSIMFGVGSLLIHQFINMIPPFIISYPFEMMRQYLKKRRGKHPIKSALNFFKIGKGRSKDPYDDENEDDNIAILWLRGTRRLQAQSKALDIFKNI